MRKVVHIVAQYIKLCARLLDMFFIAGFKIVPTWIVIRVGVQKRV